MEQFFGFILDLAKDWGYLGIVFLMAIESSFIPFPSEIVIPPAAYLAYTGDMNIYLVVLFGVLGSLIGASVNYFLAMGLGRPLVYTLVEKKWARLFLLSKKSVEKSESYFLKYGGISTFLGRLVPAVRQLISLPAGFVKMKFSSFLFFTFLGSALWVSILAALGYFFGAKQEVFKLYYKEISMVLIVFAVLILAFYAYFRSKRRVKTSHSV